MPRRRLIASGARLIGALSLGPVAGLVAEGCARQPKTAVGNVENLLNVQFEVAGSLASGNASTPYYYLAVINLTNSQSDPGPVAISGLPIGNGIAAPAILSSTVNYQTFCGYILYDTSLSNYTVYTARTVTNGGVTTFEPASVETSYSVFPPIGTPDRYALPGVAGAANTFNATLDLTRIKPPDATTLPLYAQVNFITYSYLASGSAYNGEHYYDAIGHGARTSTDYVVLQTNQPGQAITSMYFQDSQGAVMDQFGNSVTSATDQAVANLQITSWSAQILSS